MPAFGGFFVVAPFDAGQGGADAVLPPAAGVTQIQGGVELKLQAVAPAIIHIQVGCGKQPLPLAAGANRAHIDLPLAIARGVRVVRHHWGTALGPRSEGQGE